MNSLQIDRSTIINLISVIKLCKESTSFCVHAAKNILIYYSWRHCAVSFEKSHINLEMCTHGSGP